MSETPALDYRTVQVDGIDLHWVEVGPGHGPSLSMATLYFLGAAMTPINLPRIEPPPDPGDPQDRDFACTRKPPSR